ncbi:MAG: dihydrofolate reductase family protein [Ruminococcus sp.]|nr:dihydrofolate reductase family protein [Ruminococcus sp.]
MERPYIICHMVMSLDGKVTGAFLRSQQCEQAEKCYYQINRDYHADAFACGRITMEESFTHDYQPDLSEFKDVKVKREDFVANNNNGFFAVSFDRYGKLGWKINKIEDDDDGYGNAHIIEVLCETVSDDYLAYLRNIGVSYIFGGKEKTDLPLVLDKLYNLFGIRKLLLEGGSVINGVFELENVIDELSIVLAPVVAETDGKPLFYNSNIEGYELSEIKRLSGSSVWLNYIKNKKED